MKLYRKRKYEAARPVLTIGPLSILFRPPETQRLILAAFHWRWSITWRWVLSVDKGWRGKVLCVYRHNFGGRAHMQLPAGRMLCFSWQGNMRREE